MHVSNVGMLPEVVKCYCNFVYKSSSEYAIDWKEDKGWTEWKLFRGLLQPLFIERGLITSILIINENEVDRYVCCKIKGMNCLKKDMWDRPCLIQL